MFDDDEVEGGEEAGKRGREMVAMHLVNSAQRRVSFPRIAVVIVARSLGRHLGRLCWLRGGGGDSDGGIN